MYERKGDGLAHCFVYHSADGLVLYPFLLRRIDDLPQFRGIEKCWDTTTPYGYGGPLWRLSAKGSLQALGSGFLVAFHSYCSKHKIVSEFARLHPLIGNDHLLPAARVTQRHETVVLDLDQPDSEIWRGIRKGHRSSIKKGLRSKVDVVHDEKLAYLDIFFRLYTETMERQGGAASYFLPLDFFSNTLTMLGDHASLFVAMHEEEVATAAIFLRYGDFVHYHFSGADADLRHLCANHVLIHEVAKWARARGAKTFHLGGGLGQDDNLFLFKSGFSRRRTMFHTYACIHDPARYKGLVEKREESSACGEASKGKHQFFPQYRA